MTPLVFSAKRLITSSGTVEGPRITVDPNGVIQSIESCAPGQCDDTVLAPAFFDIHTHGAANHDVMDPTPEALTAIGGFLATHGVAHYLATTVTAPLETTLRALEALATAIESQDQSQPTNCHPEPTDCHPERSEGPAFPPTNCHPERSEGPAFPPTNCHPERSEGPAFQNTAIPVGIHLEGPFLSHSKRGVHPTEHLLEPSVDTFTQLWQAARGHIRLLTLAPELPGALELCRHATDLGVRLSLGHSDATAAEARAAIVAGATSATHTFNAMRRLDHREPGLAGVVLDSDDLYAELICDGIHVAPEFVRLWLRAKGPDRAILVTDGISATGMPDGEYALGGLSVAVKNGRCLLASDLKRGIETLAGSVLTMDAAVHNLRRFTGLSLDSAIRTATTNPAQMLGLPELGEIAVGQPATFNIFSPAGDLLQTVLRGHSVRS